MVAARLFEATGVQCLGQRGVASVFLTVSRTLAEIAAKIGFFAGFLGFSKPIEWGFWGVSGA
jgi:hypothetical protein